MVDEYRGDPILSSMSVPRVVIDEAAVTLRFAVSDVAEEPVVPVSPEAIRADWLRHVGSSVIRRFVEKSELDQDMRETALSALSQPALSASASSVGVKEMDRAVAGDPKAAASATARNVMAGWDALPTPVQRALGGKAKTRRRIERDLREELPTFIGRQREIELVRAALASRIEIALKREDLPSDPAALQEFRITLRGQDVDVLLNESGRS
jgi:hypothetical protein